MYRVKSSSKGPTFHQTFDFYYKITLLGAKWRHHKRFDSQWKPLLPSPSCHKATEMQHGMAANTSAVSSLCGPNRTCRDVKLERSYAIDAGTVRLQSRMGL
jgi:hypothetical protein